MQQFRRSRKNATATQRRFAYREQNPVTQPECSTRRLFPFRSLKFPLVLFVSLCFVLQAPIVKALAEALPGDDIPSSATRLAQVFSQKKDLEQRTALGTNPTHASTSVNLHKSDAQQSSNAAPTYTLNGTILTIQGPTSGAAAELPDTSEDYMHWLVAATAETANPITDDQLRAITEVHISGNVVAPALFYYGFGTSEDSYAGWDKLQKIVVDDGSSFSFVPNADCWSLFYNDEDHPSQLQSITGNIDFSNVNDASKMFTGCSFLRVLPERFALNFAQNYRSMFAGCSSLETIPNTFKPADNADMSGMFMLCSKLKNVPFTNIKPADCAAMFVGCTSLTDISALASWDVSGVKWSLDDGKLAFMGLLAGCTSLTDVSPLARWSIDSSCKEMIPIPDFSLNLSGLTGMFGKIDANIARMLFGIQEEIPAPPITRMSFAAASGWQNMDSEAMNSIGVWQPAKEQVVSGMTKTVESDPLADSEDTKSLAWVSADTPSKGYYPTTQALFDNFEAWGKEGTWVADYTPGPTPGSTPDPTPGSTGQTDAAALPATGDLQVSTYFWVLVAGAGLAALGLFSARFALKGRMRF